MVRARVPSLGVVAACVSSPEARHLWSVPVCPHWVSLLRMCHCQRLGIRSPCPRALFGCRCCVCVIARGWTFVVRALVPSLGVVAACVSLPEAGHLWSVPVCPL